MKTKNRKKVYVQKHLAQPINFRLLVPTEIHFSIIKHERLVTNRGSVNNKGRPRRYNVNSTIKHSLYCLRYTPLIFPNPSLHAHAILFPVHLLLFEEVKVEKTKFNCSNHSNKTFVGWRPPQKLKPFKRTRIWFFFFKSHSFTFLTISHYLPSKLWSTLGDRGRHRSVS